MNEELLKEIRNQNYEEITKRIEAFLLGVHKQTKTEGFVLGMSGGIDSAVVAFLCSRIMKDRTLALIMPDSKITPKTETESALLMIDKLGIEYKLLDIHPIVNEFSKYLEPNDFAQGNLRARIRTNILYYYANSKKLLVVGSSDRSEYEIGYFTKFGDGASDVVPIISLYKLQVRELARYLNVPEDVVTKKSSPHLWQDHVAETELGASYEEIDSVLYLYLDKKLPKEDVATTAGIPQSLVDKIIQLHKNSEHKRSFPQGP